MAETKYKIYAPATSNVDVFNSNVKLNVAYNTYGYGDGVVQHLSNLPSNSMIAINGTAFILFYTDTPNNSYSERYHFACSTGLNTGDGWTFRTYTNDNAYFINLGEACVFLTNFDTYAARLIVAKEPSNEAVTQNRFMNGSMNYTADPKHLYLVRFKNLYGDPCGYLYNDEFIVMNPIASDNTRYAWSYDASTHTMTITNKSDDPAYFIDIGAME